MDRWISYYKILAQKVDNGNPDICIAQRYLQRMEWGKAFKALETGIGKGGLDDPEAARELLDQTLKAMRG